MLEQAPEDNCDPQEGGDNGKQKKEDGSSVRLNIRRQTSNRESYLGRNTLCPGKEVNPDSNHGKRIDDAGIQIQKVFSAALKADHAECS